MRSTRLCSLDGCERKHQGLGFCSMHYTRLRAQGDPHKTGKSGQSTRPTLDNFMNRVPDGLSANNCWEWQGGIGSNGYGSFSIEGRTIGAHRASYILHVGPLDPGMHVLHACDNKKCVNPVHLSAGTHADNMADMTARERNRFADDHQNAKLTSGQVIEMRMRHESGETVTSLASAYGIGLATASRAINAVDWKKLKPTHRKGE